MRLNAQAIHKQRRRRLLAAIGAVLSALFVMQGVVPTSAMGATRCLVKDLRTGKSSSRLQVAVDTAKTGSHLLVKGTCHGTTVIDKDLVIRGRSSSRGRPVLDGDGKGRVLRVKSSAKSTLQSLTIQDGRAKSGSGGAIVNRGKLMLYGVVVRRSRANGRGGGVYNEGNLQINSTSDVRGNEAAAGGGVYNTGVIRLKGTSRVRGNEAAAGGGVYNTGALWLRELSRVKNNRTRPSGSGGGVHNEGVMSLRGSSRVRGNTADVGGGVANDGGTLAMGGSNSVNDNYARLAGGVLNYAGSTLTMQGSSTIHDNGAADAGGLGNAGMLVGVKCGPGSQANVFGNTPDDCRLDWSTGGLISAP